MKNNLGSSLEEIPGRMKNYRYWQ